MARTQNPFPAGTGHHGRGVEDQILTALEGAARLGLPAPGHRVLGALVSRSDRPVRAALAKLESLGCIRRVSSPVGNRYEIPALGLITAPHHRMPSPTPKSGQRAAWNRKRDPGLTTTQRQILSAVRLEIAETGEASPAKIARRMGISEHAASGRLRRVALRGYLVRRPDGHYVLGTQTTAEPDGIRTEIRDGVRVTICPPRYADGALIFPSALGRGPGGRR